jgi:hypothetical protein
VRRRHPDVDDRKVRLLLADELEQLARVGGLADDLEAGRSSRLARPSRNRMSSSAMTTRPRVGAASSARGSTDAIIRRAAVLSSCHARRGV